MVWEIIHVLFILYMYVPLSLKSTNTHAYGHVGSEVTLRDLPLLLSILIFETVSLTEPRDHLLS